MPADDGLSRQAEALQGMLPNRVPHCPFRVGAEKPPGMLLGGNAFHCMAPTPTLPRFPVRGARGAGRTRLRSELEVASSDSTLKPDP